VRNDTMSAILEPRPPGVVIEVVPRSSFAGDGEANDAGPGAGECAECPRAAEAEQAAVAAADYVPVA
jgi:hypothetical protein